METKIINLPYLNDTFPILATDLVDRSGYIDAIQSALERNDVVFITGDEGLGKTTLLAQFCILEQFNCISHFITPSIRITYNPQCVEYNLLNQIYFYCNNTKLEDDNNISLETIAYQLFRKINIDQRNGKKTYFVFDGMSDISNADIDSLKYIFSNLPTNKAKFIFSGENQHIRTLLPLKIKSKSLELIKFNYTDVISYFGNFQGTQDSFKEIYKISLNGQPDRLSHIKRLCIDAGGIETFLNGNINEKTDLFDLDWQSCTLKKNIDAELLLALLAFSDIRLDLECICKIMDMNNEKIDMLTNNICFVYHVENSIEFISEKHKNFTKGKLNSYRDIILKKLIEFYEENPQDSDSIYNLPSLYQKAQAWGDLISFLNIQTFIQIVEKFRSFGNVKKQFDYGYNAAKIISDKNFDGNFMRFALHKSSINELEKSELWESEVEAYIALNNYERAIALANSVYLKEDKLRLFATIAKQRKKKSLPEDKVLTETIQDLYNEIDFTLIPDKGLDIAQLLMYTSFELCLDLIDKLTNNTSGNISTDQIYAFLSISIIDENKKEHPVVDFDLINSRIKDNEIKKLTSSLKSLTSEFNAEEMLIQVESIDSNQKKLFLLRNWIVSNKERDDVYKMIDYAINLIISDSDKITPNATALSEIASPLPNIKSEEILYKLVGLFDSQKNTIVTPTRDYIKLQLTVASSLYPFNKKKSSERFFDVYLYIEEEISDLSVKVDCLAIFWNKLVIIDVDNNIEKSISSEYTIENQLKRKLNDLLFETAYHFRMLEPIIKTLICSKPYFIKEIIKNINTQDRRDQAYKTATIEYTKSVKLDNFNFNLVDEFTSLIAITENKEDIIIELIKRFYKEKDKAIPHLESIRKYMSILKELSHIEDRCIATIQLISILNFDFENQKKHIENLLKSLKETWNIIDVPWRKIEIGFTIANKLSIPAKDEALFFLNKATELKQSETLSSSSNVNTYMLSTKLCIRAYGGLINAKLDTPEHLLQITEIIEKINSYGEELKLWNKVALHFYANNNKDKFNNIVRNNINILLQRLDKNDKAFYEHIVGQIAPSIFFHSHNLFKELIEGTNIELKDYCIDRICDFIFTKYCYDEQIEDSEDGYSIEYAEYLDLIELLIMIDNDILIYDLTKKITLSIKYNKDRLISNEQRNNIIAKLYEIIKNKLPYPKGIKHDGYLIACKALLLSIEGYQKNKNEWDKLINETLKIINLSDKAFVLTLIAISVDKKNVKIDLLDKAFNYIKKISSTYDKSNRFDSCLAEWLNIDKGLFTKNLKVAYEDLLMNKDGSISNIKSLIDFAQQHDDKLAEDMVNMLDNDPARLKYKDAMIKRLEKNKRIESAKKNYNNIDTLNTDELNSLFNKNISQLGNGKITSRNILETYPILEKISNLPLSDAYSSASYFIENIIKKQESNKIYSENLKSIFQATYENAKLIAILSADSVTKMKAIYKFSVKDCIKNPIIRHGDNGKATDYLKKWILENVKSELIIIDPYFTESDLNWLMIIKEISNEIEIRILTSKLSGKNSGDNNKELYTTAWKKISVENPPETSITIIWNKIDKKCPFHDRWWIADKCSSGLHLNSLNGLGSRDSQIINLDNEALINVDRIIDDYIYKRIKNINGFSLKYESFELTDN